MIGEMKLKLDHIKTAREIIGAYGECAGLTCPNCGSRQYPEDSSGEVVKCLDCGEPYCLPYGYYWHTNNWR